MAARWRPRFGSGEILVLIVIGVLTLVIVTGHYKTILEMLFHPYAVILVLVMLVEYLLLKGADRSPIYQRELEVARQKRRDDLLVLRDMESQLVDLRARLNTLSEQSADPGALHDAVEASRRTTDEVLGRLRDRI